ncbi:MAG: response regulator, partial [Pseudomonadota bacterium]
MMDASQNHRIRVLVVDDSVLMGRQIAGILSQDPEIEVIGRAKDGVEALEKIDKFKPDVVTLDVEMPKMNGITALKHIMVKHSTPTVMISSLTREGARTTFDALRYGAIDVIAKPSKRDEDSLEAQKSDIVGKVKKAAKIRTGRSRYVRISAAHPRRDDTGEPHDASTRFIGIGAGTGGYYSLLRLIPALPPGFKDIVIAVILVSPVYVAPFTAYLAENSGVPVKQAAEAYRLEKGTCYVGSGVGELFPPDSQASGVLGVPSHAPPGAGPDQPIDRLFGSLARLAGNRAVGVIMSGSGDDGA